MNGRILAVCISEKRGTKKSPIPCGAAVENHGILGDAHAGDTRKGFEHRQVSLLANESVDTMRDQGIHLSAGDFGENILTEGIELKTLPVGAKLSVGSAEMIVTQIGKECHHDCEIRRQVGKCVMPQEGIFARVVKSGEVRSGDGISVIKDIREPSRVHAESE